MPTQKLMVLYITVPCDAPKSKADAPKITLNTMTLIWSGKRKFTEENSNSLKNSILELTKTFIIDQPNDKIIVLGWRFEKGTKKQLDIEINNSVYFRSISEFNTSFIRIVDMLEAKMSPKRTLLQIFQKTSSDTAMNILTGKYTGEIDPDERVIILG